MESFINIAIGLTSAIIAILGYKFVLNEKSRVSISYFIHSCIPLFDDNIKTLNDLKITFHGKDIHRNLILYKASIYNSGNQDISLPTDFPFRIILPPNYKWLQFNITAHSNGLAITHSDHAEVMSIEWNLLKQDEYFTFDSLLEYSEPSGDPEPANTIVYNLLSKISFNERIQNLKEVKEESLLRPNTRILILSIISLALILTLSFGFFAPNNYSSGYYQTINGKTGRVYFERLTDSTVIVTSDDFDHYPNKIYNLSEQKEFLYNNIQIKYKIDYTSLIPRILLIVLLIYILYEILLYLYKLKYYNRRIKAMKKFSQFSSK